MAAPIFRGGMLKKKRIKKLGIRNISSSAYVKFVVYGPR